jgi:hypothetical protein
VIHGTTLAENWTIFRAAWHPLDMLPDHALMTCQHCHQPAILTVDGGMCPRCFYRLECEAICAAAEEEVDRMLSEETFTDTSDGVAEPAHARVPPPVAAPVWSW